MEPFLFSMLLPYRAYIIHLQLKKNCTPEGVQSYLIFE